MTQRGQVIRVWTEDNVRAQSQGRLHNSQNPRRNETVLPSVETPMKHALLPPLYIPLKQPLFLKWYKRGTEIIAREKSLFRFVYYKNDINRGKRLNRNSGFNTKQWIVCQFDQIDLIAYNDYGRNLVWFAFYESGKKVIEVVKLLDLMQQFCRT